MQITRKDDMSNNFSYFHHYGVNNQTKAVTNKLNIYVGNLAFDVTEEDLRKTFSTYGKITDVKVIKDRESGEPRGFGFVEMPAAAEARSAIKNLNGTELKGQTVKVSVAKSKISSNL
jgi:RNA recognition motif-containing protein